MAIGHKSNWEVLNSEPVEKSAKFRDVYEEQQLRRSDQPEVQTMTSRNVMLAIAVTLEVLFVWFLVALFETMSYSNTYGGLPAGVGLGSFMGVSLLKLFWVALMCVPTWLIAHRLLVLNLKAQNLLADDADINQHTDDQHIALPMEVFTQYDWFPDVGAHSSVSPSTMISHAMLSNKGVKRIEVVVPGDDEDAEGEFYDVRSQVRRRALRGVRSAEAAAQVVRSGQDRIQPGQREPRETARLRHRGRPGQW